MSDTGQAKAETSNPPPAEQSAGTIEPPLISINKDKQEKPEVGKQNVGAKPKQNPGDRMQEKMLQIKALKDERRTQLDGRTEFLFSRLSDSIGIDVATVEDMILGDEKFEQLEEFFKANGRKTLLFLYQEVKNEPTNVYVPGAAKSSTKKKLVITTGEDEVNIELLD